VCDGEHPRPEARLVALEAVEVAQHADEYLAREVDGLGGPLERRPATAGENAV
jgi:hypothetical protein